MSHSRMPWAWLFVTLLVPGVTLRGQDRDCPECTQPRSRVAVDTNRAITDPAWADTNTAHTIPIVFTASGGISLGAYQAGVAWAAIAFMRAANASDAYRASHKLPAFRLDVTTGASAGNVNALISAIEWCE